MDAKKNTGVRVFTTMNGKRLDGPAQEKLLEVVFQGGLLSDLIGNAMSKVVADGQLRAEDSQEITNKVIDKLKAEFGEEYFEKGGQR